MKLTRCRAVTALVLSTGFAFACASDGIAAPGERAETPELRSVPSSSGAAIDKKSFVVSVEVPKQVASGARDKVLVLVTPKPGWKLNMQFPTKLTVVPPGGVTVDKAKLRKGDAAHFSEKKGKFEVWFKSSSAGDKEFTGKFKFAVCTEKSCDPKTVKLSWVVSVK